MSLRAALNSFVASLRQDERGAALVEFAVSLPVLVALFVGVIDLGAAMYRWMQVIDMAEAGTLYATNNAQQLYSGPVGGGAFPYSNIQNAATNAGSGLVGATVTVVGVCSCLPTIPTTCPSATQFAASNTSNPYCSAICPSPASDPAESAYVCITTSYAYSPIVAVPFIPAVSLATTSMVKIH